NALEWWWNNWKKYPKLSHMALCYLMIPHMLMSVGVECLFSKGHILITHLCNGLSAASIQAILCPNDWAQKGYVKDKGVLA
ncbi:hypothetical protein FOMPIDRAFT_1098524, partial [Fomitopsis schrenkii]